MKDKKRQEERKPKKYQKPKLEKIEGLKTVTVTASTPI